MPKLTKDQRDELIAMPVFKKLNKLISGVYLLSSIAMDWTDEVEIELRKITLSNGHSLRSGKIKSKIDNLNTSFDAFVSTFESMMGVDAKHYFSEDFKSVEKALRGFVEGEDNEQKGEKQ